MTIGEIITWVITNKMQLIAIWLQIIGVASIIVKMTPTLKDDAILKKVIRFTGKYLALNRK